MLHDVPPDGFCGPHDDQNLTVGKSPTSSSLHQREVATTEPFVLGHAGDHAPPGSSGLDLPAPVQMQNLNCVLFIRNTPPSALSDLILRSPRGRQVVMVGANVPDQARRQLL